MWPWRREFASGNTPHRTVGNANWIHPPAAQPAVANESRLLEPSPPPGTQGSVPRLSAGRQSEFGHFWVTAWWPRSSRTPGLSSFLTGRARSCTPTSQSAEALGRPVCWYKRVGSSQISHITSRVRMWGYDGRTRLEHREGPNAWFRGVSAQQKESNGFLV